MKKRRGIEIGSISTGSIAVFLLGSIFLLGGLAGYFLAARLQGDGGTALQGYLRDYLSVTAEQKIQAEFWAAVWEQLKFPLLVFVFSFTAIGVVGIPILFFIRGFLFVFSVGCLFRILGETGFFPALLLFGLPALLWAPTLFLMGTQAIQSAYAMLRRCLGDGVRPAFLQGRYWVCCGLCGIVLAICVLFEYFALPVLMRAASAAQ